MRWYTCRPTPQTYSRDQLRRSQKHCHVEPAGMTPEETFPSCNVYNISELIACTTSKPNSVCCLYTCLSNITITKPRSVRRSCSRQTHRNFPRLLTSESELPADVNSQTCDLPSIPNFTSFQACSKQHSLFSNQFKRGTNIGNHVFLSLLHD